MRFLCSLPAFSLSHSVEYKNHTVKQRIYQDKKKYAPRSFFIYTP